jgi:O-antigen/teichoic acid export membrane protein
MNQLSRKKNSIKNAALSVLMQLFLLLFSFVSRSVFIKVLGDQYLGISGLYTNLLSVLSLADLGITTVMTFSLYKPISQKKTKEITVLLSFFKRIYYSIALVIFLMGLCLVPFLQYLINGSMLELQELRIYYILFLLNSACSYLVVYKSTLIIADQKIYIVKIVEFVARIVLDVFMIVVLLVTGSYLLFLIGNIVATILKNISLSVISNRLYPFIRKVDKTSVSPETKRALIDNIKSLFIYRVSAMIMNSTDNILISVILGTVIVGYYSNYLMIVTAINTFILLVAQSLLASIGNFHETSNSQKKLELFQSMLLVFFVIGCFCSSCFLTMFNDFIYIWIGKKESQYILSSFDVGCISFNFFVSCVANPNWMFREATGVFKQTKYSMTCAAVLNLIISIVLGKTWGLGGIIAATAISKLLTNFWFDPFILYKQIFCSRTIYYWKYIIKELICTFACLAIALILCRLVPVSIFGIFIKIAICFLVTFSFFYLYNRRTKEIVYYQETFSPYINKFFGIK